MYGVKFGDKHSYDDFGLILSSKEIGLPEPQTETISVVGRDGDIDLTNVFGDNVTYKNRTLQFSFTALDCAKSWASVLSELSNYLHGQKMRIILDADRSFYYYGRCTINNFKSDKTTATIVVTCDCEPYKMDIIGAGTPWEWDTFSFLDGIIYINEVTVSGSKTVNLRNRRKRISPTFTCSTTMTLTYDGTEYNLSTGKTTLYDILLVEGDNEMTLTGNGTVQIEYKGGSL